ncbi:hypothetical protein [Geodermatophilus marinus]|uniref:hypothetical protein n=1 Tax=Geodermatophilus sp. LHW52908 TaxID=2303986 RepID=UPI0011C1611E|nr:hypothetical protein [Geodermatophilus sp. LHW52908]
MVLASVLSTVGVLAPAVADSTTVRTYAGPAYDTSVSSAPTSPETRSALWFHAGAWWAMLLEPTGRTVRVFELMPDHSWRPTSAVVNPDAGDAGDALLEGDTVHTVSRRSDGVLYYTRLAFDPATRDYRAAPARLVTTRGGAATASLIRDSTGRLWVSYADFGRVVVTYSDSGGQWWGENFPLAVKHDPSTAESAAVVVFDDRVGVLWSDQSTGSFEFAWHQDGDAPGLWSYEQALTGPAQADNHISVAAVQGEPSDLVVAAVKTSRNDEGEPSDALLLELLVRSPDGQWSASPISTIGDALNNPILQVDETTRTLHLFAAWEGQIVTKRASLDDLRFEPGLGEPFVLGEGRLLDPTGAKHPVNARTGLVILASDAANGRYRHAEAPIMSPTPPTDDETDRTPPEAPHAFQGRAVSPDTVVLSWAEVTEADRWAPARDGTPAQAYVLQRDGTEIATVRSTSFRDQLISSSGRDGETAVEYAVVALDVAGNRSEAVRIVVEMPEPDSGTSTQDLAGWALLPLAAIAGLLAFRSAGRRR